MKRSNPFQFKHSFFLVFNGLFYKTARHLSKNTYTTELKSLQSNNSKLHTQTLMMVNILCMASKLYLPEKISSSIYHGSLNEEVTKAIFC